MSGKPDGQKPRVLIIDDDPQVLKLMGTILGKAGYSVRLEPSGTRVLPVLRDESFDLLVLDLFMPEPDGFELLKTVRGAMPGVRTLVISGYMDGVLLEAAQVLGATATLSKTDVPVKLLSTVNDLLGQ